MTKLEVKALRLMWRKDGHQLLRQRFLQALDAWNRIKDRESQFAHAIRDSADAYDAALEAFERSWEKSNSVGPVA